MSGIRYLAKKYAKILESLTEDRQRLALTNRIKQFDMKQVKKAFRIYKETGILIIVNINIDDLWYFEIFNTNTKRNSEIQTPKNHYKSMKKAYKQAFKFLK